MNSTKLIEKYRKEFKKAVEDVMSETGNFEATDFILESALDLALNDKSNEIYK